MATEKHSVNNVFVPSSLGGTSSHFASSCSPSSLVLFCLQNKNLMVKTHKAVGKAVNEAVANNGTSVMIVL